MLLCAGLYTSHAVIEESNTRALERSIITIKKCDDLIHAILKHCIKRQTLAWTFPAEFSYRGSPCSSNGWKSAASPLDSVSPVIFHVLSIVGQRRPLWISERFDIDLFANVYLFLHYETGETPHINLHEINRMYICGYCPNKMTNPIEKT